MDAIGKAAAEAAQAGTSRVTVKTDPKVAAQVWVKSHNGVKGARRYAVKLFNALTPEGQSKSRAWFNAVLEAIGTE
jgi:hypothetical protein